MESTTVFFLTACLFIWDVQLSDLSRVWKTGMDSSGDTRNPDEVDGGEDDEDDGCPDVEQEAGADSSSLEGTDEVELWFEKFDLSL